MAQRTSGQRILRGYGMEDKIIIIVSTRQYMPVKSVSELYECSPQTVRRNIAKIKECGRYKGHKIVIDEDGKYLVDSLIYEDFLANKTALMSKNLARQLEPYSPAKIREARGEYKRIWGQ